MQAILRRGLHAHQVYGANTNVGKTVVSTLLCNAVPNAGFLKPVSTGDDADHTHVQRFSKGITKCLYEFDEPISPHLAAVSPPSNKELLSSIRSTLTSWSKKVDFCLVETAGGVHSPGPDGTSQADLYRPLRLPVILIADYRLGGISSSVSAYESLKMRGYDVHAVLVFQDGYYRNHEYLGDYFTKRGIQFCSLPLPPPKKETGDVDAMTDYYQRESGSLTSLVEELKTKNAERIDQLQSMAERAHSTIWYPFTQHQNLDSKDITVIDSAYSDYFQTFDPKAEDENMLSSSFDGSASWWTQGLGHGNPELALSAAYAAGRYGHVILAGTVHQPALELAEKLLRHVDNPRLKRAFFTDNGSTGMEAAVKMALRASCQQYQWKLSKPEDKDIGILGLKGSYHGDTMGVMDCSEPSTFNERVEWYRGRGYWFDFPVVKMTKGTWQVEDEKFSSLDKVFDLDTRLKSETADRYRESITSTLNSLLAQGRRFGALIVEPVILGAGGMLFADPLFQRTLVDVVRSFDFDTLSTVPAESKTKGLPVIFDEVFTGLYRLGRGTSASFLNVHPDISVHAKLLTGGLVPLSVTLASEEIFEAFASHEKADALLHGHSYTAHPVGCQVAVDSLRQMAEMDSSGHWKEYQQDWKDGIWSLWSKSLVERMSHHPSVDGCFALGGVLSIELKDTTSGYNSNAAQTIQQALLKGTESNVHSRVLGNVLYLMASLTAKKDEIRQIESLLESCFK
ncbi:hypothetical protein ASPZODRAFT_146961 [Penicilliopsis zonata CBS 506.65]|uniref:Dethiobiotin synthase n=1 Tax=Penicilliopsis zonata CBS 506.65 TaxID=1073090 RepID=A0A1L9S6N2_9EURO|nr:hypothetical protein ASPZODRAFT_146961 [Penicilliopsis zonata CBS 506.65]OJJ42790.1 hypothetical protein ASPZODRAFT_146961 [Penicilliopsis zonata CBS 506.65]